MPPSTVSGSAPTPQGMPPTHLPGGGSNAPTHLPPSFAHLPAQRSLPFSVPFQRLPLFRHPRKPLAPSFINAVCTHPGACARESNPTSALETHSHTPTPHSPFPPCPLQCCSRGPPSQSLIHPPAPPHNPVSLPAALIAAIIIGPRNPAMYPSLSYLAARTVHMILPSMSAFMYVLPSRISAHSSLLHVCTVLFEPL